jgi:hypothetical protein
MTIEVKAIGLTNLCSWFLFTFGFLIYQATPWA